MNDDTANFAWPWLKRRPGRRKQYWEATITRLPKGVLKRINQVLRSRESQSMFLREAIDRELKAREALK